MKKFFFFAAAALVSLAASAYTINNPIGEDGRYIVKYDCAAGGFAAANDFEVDEVVTIAVDVTGTWLEEFLKGTPIAAGATRGVAINPWTNYGDTDENFRRFKQIDGNIFGLEMKLSDLLVNADKKGNATMMDSVVYVSAQIFGFEFTESNSGAGWWMWEGNPDGKTLADGSDCFFATLPYTGTKTGTSFYCDDAPGMDMFGMNKVPSYAAPCSFDDVTAVDNTVVDAKSVKFIENGQLFIEKDGVRYNVFGAQVK